MIEEFSVPSSVKTIGNGALKGLLWINEIDIPEGVERIGYNAFEGMFRVSLPSTLIEIAPDFYYEECIDDPNDVPYITVHSGNKTFVSNNGSLYFRESGKLALDSEYHGKLTMYDTNMTERANVVYNEVSASFQQGDGSVELDMLDNLHDILKFVDDDFIGQFSFAVNNELVEIEDDEGSTPMYDNPSVTFRMLHNKRIYFTVDCGGVRCVNPDHPVFGEEGSKYPACFIPNDVVGFRFEVNENNECVALEFIEYFTKNFIRNKEWI